MLEPLISVVIPSYNHERFLAEAIASAREQSIREIEIIVVDDGSSDGSYALALEIAASDARINVIQQGNQGSHSALNNGIALASGAWITALNSDDRWHPRRLERMLRDAANARADFLFTDLQLIDENGKANEDPAHWWNAVIQQYRERVEVHGLRDGLMFGNLTVSTSNFLFNREVWNRVGPFRSYRYNLDWDFVLRCMMEEGLRVHYLRERLLDYRLHGSNTILGGMPVAAIEALGMARQLLKRHFQIPEGLVLSQHRHERLLRRFISNKAVRAAASEKLIIDDRDRLEDMLVKRQQIIEHEREVSARETRILQANFEAAQSDIQVLLVSLEKSSEHGRMLESCADLLKQEKHQLEQEKQQLEQDKHQFEADRQALAQDKIRLEEGLTNQQRELQVAAIGIAALRDELKVERRLRGELDVSVAQARRALNEYYGRSRLLRAWDTVRGQKLPALDLLERSADLASFSALGGIGQVRHVHLDAVDLETVDASTAKINVHLHLYYLDLAEEMLGYVCNLGAINKLIVTGPWAESDLAPYLVEVNGQCADVVVDKIENRGKDVGGFLHAITQRGLLDCDYLLKLHSKKSSNPASYFDAISQLFETNIVDGDQWRKLIIEPMAGDRRRAESVIKLFASDRLVGMVGPGQFITTAPDVNAELYENVCEQLGAKLGLPFFAGTMFWARASALSSLVDKAPGLDDFNLDSLAVEGGLEHIFERVFGSLVLSRGFDLAGVR